MIMMMMTGTIHLSILIPQFGVCCWDVDFSRCIRSLDCSRFSSKTNLRNLGNLRQSVCVPVCGSLHASIDLSGHASRRSWDKQPMESTSFPPKALSSVPQPSTSHASWQWRTKNPKLSYSLLLCPSSSSMHASFLSILPMISHLLSPFSFLLSPALTNQFRNSGL